MKRYYLTCEIIVRNSELDSLVVYPAGTRVDFSDITHGKERQMGYLEYNDEDISKRLVRVNSGLRERNVTVLSRLQKITGKGYDETENTLAHETYGSYRALLNHSFNDTKTGKKTSDATKTENEVIEVMLMEDQMLKFQPQDQFKQRGILERTRTNDHLQKVQRKGHSETDPDALKRPKEQVTVTRLQDLGKDTARQNESTNLLHPWPDVALDEASEPLFSEGFLERVQKIKKEMYNQPRLKAMVRKYYILNSPYLCQGIEKIDIVYLIHSQTYSKDHRQRLRKTILNPDTSKPFNIVHVFLLGKPRIPQFQEDLRLEWKSYGDIVQGDFDDTPNNDAWKGLMGMRWVLQFCNKVNFVVKFDENVVVDSYAILKGLVPASANIIGKRAMFCALSSNSSVLNSPWNVSIPFCEGFAVLMTRHVICSLVAASNQIRVLPVEDYYLFGILPFVVGGVELYNLDKNLGFQKSSSQALSCFIDKQEKCPVVAVKSEPGSLTSLWKLIEARRDRMYEWPTGNISLWDLHNVKSSFR